ncbi:MFS multidrug transporter [Colletotrichum plurivorum]|uniref:MFS multidrug transporter n=1 Tax=Colletotrichum plurivorum TaxID=2175906 RepID=A0A8H6K4N2_9PEZI|nr:MFS multidrug transporter [Colletotrichum plurivorum]
METPVTLTAEKATLDLEASSDAPSTATKDSNLVDWDGPADPWNPLNWSAGMRYGQVVIVSLLSLVVNLAATMIAPGMEYVVRDIKITSQTVGTLSVTIYLLGFGLGPLVISSACEMHGRLIVYHVCNVLFIAFIIGTALSQTVPQLLVFRVLSGIAGSAPMTIGGGTIADVIPVEHRGPAGALFALGPLMGPVLGPVIGGFLSTREGWRWTFWLMAIMSGVMSIIALIFLRETHPNILLSRKAARLRQETGNPDLFSKLDRRLTPSQILIGAFVRTGKLLIFSPIVLIMSLYVGLVFGLLYLLFTTITPVFQGVYGFGAEIVGLAYLGIGIGELCSLVIFGTLSDRVSSWRAKVEGRAVPEHRLILMMCFAPVMTVGFFIYGWTAHYQVHWIAPIIGTFFIGFGAFFVILPAQIYLVDVFGSEAAASALGANILLRCLFGAFLPLAGPKMYETLNYGWGNTLLGFLSLAFVPAPMLFYKFGGWLRSKTPTTF